MRLRYKIRVTLLSFWLVSLAHEYASAQKTDTLSALREFVAISNGYKQLPLHLELEMKSSTNFITGENDTADVNGEFFLGTENSYVRFGEFEQVVNDSLALLVSHQFQQMILYPNAGAIIKQMKNMMGAALPDSSILNLSRKYISVKKELEPGTSVVELQSRASLYGTKLPRETIELQYDAAKRNPKQVITTSRTVLPLDSIQYAQMQNEKGMADKLFTLEGNYFLVKEQVTTYLYKQVERAPGVKIPVVIGDRIVKNETGAYEPTEKYNAYKISIND
jgi:hypothetical protein